MTHRLSPPEPDGLVWKTISEQLTDCKHSVDFKTKNKMQRVLADRFLDWGSE